MTDKKKVFLKLNHTNYQSNGMGSTIAVVHKPLQVVFGNI